MTHASQRYAIAIVLALAGHVATAVQPSAAALAGVPRFTRQQMWVNAPDPTYPLAARQNYVQGRGVFQLKIHPQQRTVTRVTILQSTGSKILDDESIRVLSRWRLRRGPPMDRIDHVDVPLTFTLVAPKSSNQSLQPAPAHRITALAAYENDLCSRTRVVWIELATKRADRLAIGRVKLHFEIAPNGDVVNLKIKSNSGNQALADLAIDTIRATRIFPIPKTVVSTLDKNRLRVDFDFYTYTTR